MPAAHRSPLERALVGVLRRVERPLGRVLAAGPIRRHLHTRALHAWRASPAPLILCQGNINRSPFAEQLARRRAGGQAISAGFQEPGGRPSPPRTVAAAQAYGVDLTAHRSRVVDARLVEDATAIMGFDLQNLARLVLRHPRAWRRAHLLGALAVDGPVLIADPHGRDDAALEEALAQIATAIEAGEVVARG